MMIVCNRLSFVYGEKQILSDLTCELHPDKPLALMGPSGCGKTTLLRLLCGLEQPDAGTITGCPKGVSMVFQENRLLPQLSALGNLALIAPQTPRAQLLALLEELGIAQAANQRPKELSGGMQRRVALARAAAYQSALWLLDEPFTGLDAENRARAAAFVRRHTAGRMLLAVLHDPAEAALLGADVTSLSSLSRAAP